MTKLERVYLLNLIKSLDRTESVSTAFTTNDLIKYVQKYLYAETLGGIISVPRAEVLNALDIAGFKTKQVIKRSPNYYVNICPNSIVKVFGNIMG